MPGYIPAKLDQCKHPTPEKPQHAHTKAPIINYCQKVQKATPLDASRKLTPQGIKQIQETVGAFAWYARATDPTKSKTLSSIAGRQAEATEKKRGRGKALHGLLCHSPRCSSEVHGE